MAKIIKYARSGGIWGGIFFWGGVGGLGIGASRVIVWGLCMIDAQLAH